MNCSRISRLLAAIILSLWSLAGLALVTDRDQTIEIEADTFEYQDNEGLTVYQGNVRLTQGSIVLQADRITVYSVDGEATRLIAEGTPANYVQTIDENGETVTASSNHMEYQRLIGVLKLTDEARLTQQGTTLSGSQIEYDVQRHVLRASSQGESVRDRVRVTIPAATLREAEGDAQ